MSDERRLECPLYISCLRFEPLSCYDCGHQLFLLRAMRSSDQDITNIDAPVSETRKTKLTVTLHSCKLNTPIGVSDLFLHETIPHTLAFCRSQAYPLLRRV